MKIPPADLVRISALGEMAAFVALLAANLFARKDGLRWIGLTAGRLFGAIPVALLGILIVLPLMTWANVLTQALWESLRWEHPSEHDMLRILGETGDRSLKHWIILSAVLLAPLAEETLFRGHLQTIFAMLFMPRPRPAPPVESIPLPPGDSASLEYFTPVVASEQNVHRRAFGRWLAILFTSMIFASIHPWWSTPSIFFLSICLGYAYERTANLWVPILMHGIFNGSSVWFYLYTLRHH